MESAALSLRVVVAIAASAARNAIYGEATLERTGTLLAVLALLLGERTACLDQGRLDVDSPAKFDLLGDAPLQTDRTEPYGGLRQQRSDVVRLDVLLFDEGL